MARFQIVGLYDCPWFAKADKLADEIIATNSSIDIQREMLDQFHWNVRTRIFNRLLYQITKKNQHKKIMNFLHIFRNSSKKFEKIEDGS